MAAHDGRPMYQRLAEDLRAQIADGTLAVGAELPSTSRLMELHDVSITVARAAVKELRNEGLVVGQPGKAVYVRQVPEPSSPSSEYVEIKQQIDSLRTALDEAVEQLDQRLSRLEETQREH